MITPISSTTNVGVSVRNVPSPTGAICLAASAPATASDEQDRREAAEEHRGPAEQVRERDAVGADVAGASGWT